MSPSNEGSKIGGAFQAILVAVVVALVAGGSAPWWWAKIFPGATTDTHKTGDDRKTRPYMGALEVGTNHRGNDLSSGIETSTPQECSQMCQDNDACKAMTFVKHPSADGGVCWLKGKVAIADANMDMISAVKKYP